MVGFPVSSIILHRQHGVDNRWLPGTLFGRGVADHGAFVYKSSDLLFSIRIDGPLGALKITVRRARLSSVGYIGLGVPR